MQSLLFGVYGGVNFFGWRSGFATCLNDQQWHLQTHLQTVLCCCFVLAANNASTLWPVNIRHSAHPASIGHIHVGREPRACLPGLFFAGARMFLPAFQCESCGFVRKGPSGTRRAAERWRAELVDLWRGQIKIRHPKKKYHKSLGRSVTGFRNKRGKPAGLRKECFHAKACGSRRPAWPNREAWCLWVCGHQS